MPARHGDAVPSLSIVPGVFIPFKCLLALIARDSAVGVLKPGVKLVMGTKRPGGGVKPPAGGLAKGVWELTVP